MPKEKRGGRKAKKRLPNHKRAVFPKNKLGNYLLNPTKEPNKSRVFIDIGYNMKNADRLEADIREGLKNNKATLFAPNEYGTPAQVVMELGITKKQKIRTAWMYEQGSNAPKFITAYPD